MPGGCKFNDYPTQKTIGCILMGRADAPELSVWHRYQSFLGYDVIIRLRIYPGYHCAGYAEKAAAGFWKGDPDGEWYLRSVYPGPPGSSRGQVSWGCPVCASSLPDGGVYWGCGSLYPQAETGRILYVETGSWHCWFWPDLEPFCNKSSVVFRAFSWEFGIALLPRSGYTVYSVRKEGSE